MALSSPTFRRRKRMMLQCCIIGISIATLLLAILRPRLVFGFFAAAAVAAFWWRSNAKPSQKLMVCAAVAAIPIIYFLAYGSIPFFSDGAAAAADPAVPPRIQRLRARTRTIVRALITFFVCLYAVVLFPQTLWNALQATISYVVPSSAFGLVDRDTYERVKEETTDRELDALREHVRSHGAPAGLSSRATSRLSSFASGYIGITRSEAMQWLVRAVNDDSSSFEKEGALNDGGFQIGPDGRRIDPDDDDDDDLDEKDGDSDGEAGRYYQAEDEDAPATGGSLTRIRQRVFG